MVTLVDHIIYTVSQLVNVQPISNEIPSWLPNYQGKQYHKHKDLCNLNGELHDNPRITTKKILLISCIGIPSTKPNTSVASEYHFPNFTTPVKKGFIAR